MCFFLMIRLPPISTRTDTLFPYTTLFRSRTQILNFMNGINADIFLPIYDRQNIIAYIIVEQNARVDELFNSAERDQMLVFTSYLSRSEENTSELQSLMRISYAVFCLKKKNNQKIHK